MGRGTSSSGQTRSSRANSAQPRRTASLPCRTARAAPPESSSHRRGGTSPPSTRPRCPCRTASSRRSPASARARPPSPTSWRCTDASAFPHARGHGWEAIQQLSLDRVTRADVLYSGSTASSFTLAKSAADYQVLIVQMSGADGVVAESMPVISPNGKTIDLSNAFYAGSGYRYLRLRCAISGTSVNVVLNERFVAESSEMFHDLKITGVVGLAW